MNIELEKIARSVLHLGTLETQNSDTLDFADLSVWKVKAALEAAYAAGRQAQVDATAAAAAEIAPMTEADKAQVERDYFGGGRS